MTQLALVFALFVHAFTGTVTEVREVVLVGNTPARVALVQADFGQAWVVLRVEPGAITREPVILGEDVQPGDRVQVSISGPHVLPDSVDWRLCQPADSAYCQFGAAYEDAPLSLDWNIPLSPSNEFIHYGHGNPHYSSALYWHTTVIQPPGEAGSCVGRHDTRSCARRVFWLAEPALARRGVPAQSTRALAGRIAG